MVIYRRFTQKCVDKKYCLYELAFRHAQKREKIPDRAAALMTMGRTIQTTVEEKEPLVVGKSDCGHVLLDSRRGEGRAQRFLHPAVYSEKDWQKKR